MQHFILLLGPLRLILNIIYWGERSFKQTSTPSLVNARSPPPPLHHHSRPCSLPQLLWPHPLTQPRAPPLHWGMWVPLTPLQLPQKWGCKTAAPSLSKGMWAALPRLTPDPGVEIGLCNLSHGWPGMQGMALYMSGTICVFGMAVT